MEILDFCGNLVAPEHAFSLSKAASLPSHSFRGLVSNALILFEPFKNQTCFCYSLTPKTRPAFQLCLASDCD